jgi:hypothetical protein
MESDAKGAPLIRKHTYSETFLPFEPKCRILQFLTGLKTQIPSYFLIIETAPNADGL